MSVLLIILVALYDQIISGFSPLRHSRDGFTANPFGASPPTARQSETDHRHDAGEDLHLAWDSAHDAAPILQGSWIIPFRGSMRRLIGGGILSTLPAFPRAYNTPRPYTTISGYLFRHRIDHRQGAIWYYPSTADYAFLWSDSPDLPPATIV